MGVLRRHWRAAMVALVVAGLAVVAFWPETMEVDVASVTKGPLRVTVDEDGETRVRERFVVSAPVAGKLQRIQLEPGDPVTRGRTVVARIAPAEASLIDPRTRSELTAAIEAARAALGESEAERDRAAATLERAQTALRRQETLVAAGASARDDLEAAQTTVRTAGSAVRAAEFAVDRARRELQGAQARLTAPPSSGRVVTVLAPVDGMVLKRLRESETVVPVGEALVEIGDPKQLEIVADLLSTDAVRVPPGARVLIERWGGGHTLDGRVRRVEPSGFLKVSALGVEEQRVNVIVDFAQPEAAARALGDAYRVEVRVVVADVADALKVPVGTLFRRGNDWAAFVVESGRARLQIVQVGERNNEEAQITSGLSAGQEVVLHPPDTLVDGARIARRDAQP